MGVIFFFKLLLLSYYSDQRAALRIAALYVQQRAIARAILSAPEINNQWSPVWANHLRELVSKDEQEGVLIDYLKSVGAL